MVERARHNATSSHLGVGNIVSLTHLRHFYLKSNSRDESSYKILQYILNKGRGK